MERKKLMVATLMYFCRVTGEFMDIDEPSGNARIVQTTYKKKRKNSGIYSLKSYSK
jgi:hypothetical protein